MKSILAKVGKAVGVEEEGKGFVLALVLSLMCVVALSLLLIWLNIERTRVSYRMKDLDKEVVRLSEFSAKLDVEKEHLLSKIGEKAAELGLQPARPGQTRRMEVLSGTSPLK